MIALEASGRLADGRFGFAARQAALDRRPQRFDFLGRGPIWIDFGDAPAVTRRFLVVNAGEHQGRDQAAHRFESRSAFLDAGGLLRRRALVEDEDEFGAQRL
jgi:hypothetical protein